MISNQEDYIFVQVQEMFPQLEAEVVYMILSEHRFIINDALQSLTILSQTIESVTKQVNDQSNRNVYQNDELPCSSSSTLEFDKEGKVDFPALSDESDIKVCSVTSQLSTQNFGLFTEEKSSKELLKTVVEEDEVTSSADNLKDVKVTPQTHPTPQKYSSINSSDDLYIDADSENIVDNFSFKKFVNILSYVGVGKLNGVRLRFEGGKSRKPVLLSRLNKTEEAHKLFNDFEKQLLNTSSPTFYTETEHLPQPTPDISEQENVDLNLLQTATASSASKKQEIQLISTNEIVSSSTPTTSPNTTNISDNPVTYSFTDSFISRNSYENPPQLQRTCSPFSIPVTSCNYLPGNHHYSSMHTTVPPYYRQTNKPTDVVHPMQTSHSGWQVRPSPPPGFSNDHRQLNPPTNYRSRNSNFNINAPEFSPRYGNPPQFHDTGFHGNSGQNIMYIMRGAPGSGKTTSAKQLCGRRGVILSTDDYFMTRQGYRFDVNFLQEAHECNQQHATECVRKGRSPIIIDNTNMAGWEMKPYMVVAIKHGYQIEIKEPHTWWKFKPNELSRRNTHGVGKVQIINMLSKYEENVTIESVVGRNLFYQYQQNLKQSTSNKYVLSKHNNDGQVKTKKSLRSETAVDPVINSSSVVSKQSSKTKNAITSQPVTSHLEKKQNPTSALEQHKNKQQIKFHSQEKQSENRSLSTNRNSETTPIVAQTNEVSKITVLTRQPDLSLSDSNTCGNTNKLLQEKLKNTDERLCLSLKTELQQPTQSDAENTPTPKSSIGKMKCKNKKLAPVFQADAELSSGKMWSSFLDIIAVEENIPRPESATRTIARTVDTETLTDNSDFVLLHKIESNIEASDDNVTVIETKSSRFKPSCHPPQLSSGQGKEMYEKSTTTDDLIKVSDEEEDLMTLQKLFVDSPVEHLSDVYYKCNKNLHWTTDVIADSLLFGIAGETNTHTSATMNVDAYYDSVCASNSHDGDKDSFDESDHDKENFVKLTLPKDFLQDLIALFGGENCADIDNCTVELDLPTAKNLYDAWKCTQDRQRTKVAVSKNEHYKINELKSAEMEYPLSLSELFSSPKSAKEIAQLREDEELARKLQKEEEHAFLDHTNSPKGNRKQTHASSSNANHDSMEIVSSKWRTDQPNRESLSQIIKEEAAAAESEKRQNNEFGNLKLTSQLKREQLHSAFKSISENLLDDIFVASDYNLEEAMFNASYMLCDDNDLFNLNLDRMEESLIDVMQTPSQPQLNAASAALRDITCEDIHNDTALTYDNVRAEANLQRQQIHECQKKAAVATHQNKGALAVYYAQQASLHKKKLREANQRAAAITYKRMNEGRSPNELDLHGLHVDEAIDTLRSVIEHRRNEPNHIRHIFVITGRGLNSASGIPKIKNAVMEWLKNKNCQYTLINEGLLKVNL